MINPAKVLLVGASDIPLSQQCGDWYASVRGIGHQLYYPVSYFASGNTFATVRSQLLSPIRDYMVANSIECLITLPGVPHSFLSSEPLGPYATSAMLASAKHQMTIDIGFVSQPNNKYAVLMASRRIAALEQEAKDCKLEAKRPHLPD